MAVVINEFEAVAETESRGGGATAAGGAPARIEPAQLRPPLHRLARRHERLKAH